MTNIKKTILSALAAIMIAVIAFFSPMLSTTVYADASSTDIQAAYENLNVLDDLKGSNIGGKQF